MSTGKPAVRLEDRAAENIAFIRATLERSGRFTAVSGRGGVVMGGVAVAGWVVASAQAYPTGWLTAWIVTGGVGFVVAALSLVAKSRRLGMPVLAGPGRKFFFALAPSLVVGGLLTIPLASNGQHELLPALWLLMFGTAVTASGAFSVGAIAVMGFAYLFLGAAALVLPEFGEYFMVAGFGGLNAGFGVWIWRRYGG